MCCGLKNPIKATLSFKVRQMTLNPSSDAQCQLFQWQLTGKSHHRQDWFSPAERPPDRLQDVVFGTQLPETGCCSDMIMIYHDILAQQKESTWLRDLWEVPCLFVPSWSSWCRKSAMRVDMRLCRNFQNFRALGADDTQHGLEWWSFETVETCVKAVSKLCQRCQFRSDSKAWDVSIQVSSMAQQADA